MLAVCCQVWTLDREPATDRLIIQRHPTQADSWRHDTGGFPLTPSRKAALARRKPEDQACHRFDNVGRCLARHSDGSWSARLARGPRPHRQRHSGRCRRHRSPRCELGSRQGATPGATVLASHGADQWRCCHRVPTGLMPLSVPEARPQEARFRGLDMGVFGGSGDRLRWADASRRPGTGPPRMRANELELGQRQDQLDPAGCRPIRCQRRPGPDPGVDVEARRGPQPHTVSAHG